MNIGVFFPDSAVTESSAKGVRCFGLVMHEVRVRFCNCLSQVQMSVVLKAVKNNYQYLLSL